MRNFSLYAKSAVFSVLIFFSGGLSAHHESWHREGVTHQRNGLLVTPLRIVEKRIVIPREGCKERGDCDLKEIVFFEEDDELPANPSDPDDFLGRTTLFMAGIETETVEALTNYVFVQLIRGCMWTSQKNPDGSITNRFNINRRHLGNRTHFVFREWVVDSIHHEPAFSEDGESPDRHFLLQWSDPRPKWIPRGTQNIWERGGEDERTPTIPFGFVTDSPEPLAKYLPMNLAQRVFPDILESATNRSLEFRMCLHRTKDVPATTDGTTKGFGAPIACYEWRSSHVYDHVRGVFTSPTGIHGECRRPLNDEERRKEEFMHLR